MTPQQKAEILSEVERLRGLLREARDWLYDRATNLMRRIDAELKEKP